MTRADTLPLVAVGPEQSMVVPTARDDAGEVIALLRLAVERGVPVEALEKLVALQERYQDRAAQRAFARAFAAFQQECPTIPRLSTSKKVTGSGTTFDFTYADLETIASTVAPYLHKHGFSYSWNSVTSEKQMTTTCTLRHQDGHRECAEFACPIDSNLPIGTQQKSGSALSYGRRYSLIQVLGITSADPDTDGEDPTAVTEGQVASLEALLQEAGADRARFLKFLGVESLQGLPARRYASAVAALEAKRNRVRPA